MSQSNEHPIPQEKTEDEDEDGCCGEPCGQGFECTRPMGHDGEHVASDMYGGDVDGATVYARKPVAPAEPQTPEPKKHTCTGGSPRGCDACLAEANPSFLKKQTAAPVSSSARPDSQTVEPICVCQVDDGLVQEWVSKARAVAIGKGFNPLPRCCLDMGDGYVCALWKGHEGGCSGHREAAPRLSIEWPEVIDGYTRSEMHNAIMDGDTKIAFNVLGVVSHYYAPCSRQERIGSAPVPLSEALGSAGRSAAQENSSSSQEQADARPARTLKDYRPQHDEDCLINKCGFVWSDGKGCRVAPSDHDVYISHVLLPQPCSCGLDALLSGGHGQ